MFERNERIVELLQREVSQLVRSIQDPGLAGFLTITGADLSKDRKNAAIYYSVMGSEEEKKSTAKALERATPFLRRQLKVRMRLKYIPNLEFRYDDTPERAHRVDQILEQLKKPS